MTKCNNLRYKAKIDGNEDYGRICVENADTGLAFLRSDREDGYIAAWHCDEPGVEGCSGRKVTDFELVPRDPETYRDWQVGDIIVNRDGCTGRIIFRSGDFVAADIGGCGCLCYTCEEMHGRGYRLVLTDIEQQIIEEKKKYGPQDGDIVAWKDEEDDGNPAVSIYKAKNRSYITLFTTGSCYAPVEDLAMNIVRPATDEEKQRLFDAMAKQGKRWNAEKKVVEDIPKPYEFSEFRKGDAVLYRDYGGFWKIGVFVEMRYGYDKYVTTTDGVDECGYRECIPYNERTMHLLGTTEDYKEE